MPSTTSSAGSRTSHHPSGTQAPAARRAPRPRPLARSPRPRSRAPLVVRGAPWPPLQRAVGVPRRRRARRRRHRSRVPGVPRPRRRRPHRDPQDGRELRGPGRGGRGPRGGGAPPAGQGRGALRRAREAVDPRRRHGGDHRGHVPRRGHGGRHPARAGGARSQARHRALRRRRSQEPPPGAVRPPVRPTPSLRGRGHWSRPRPHVLRHGHGRRRGVRKGRGTFEEASRAGRRTPRGGGPGRPHT